MTRHQEGAPSSRRPPAEESRRQNEKGTHNVIKTWSRRSIVTLISSDTFAVHDGRKHVRCSSPNPWLATSSGEFAPTKTFKGHVKDDKKARR